MRHFRIFLLYFQYVFERRGVSIVWLMVMIINPMVLLIYWKSALQNNTVIGLSLPDITSYYFLLFILAALLMSHIEENVSEDDIARGNLITYIIKPYSYFWINFIRELPYRILQGFFAIIITLFFVIILGRFFQISSDPLVLLLTVFVFIFAYSLSYVYKISIGLLTFWLTDSSGLFQMLEVITIVLAGYILPLNMMPEILYKISDFLPFAYMIYYPVIILQGKLTVSEILLIISKQIIWLIVFVLIYKFLWNKGIKLFTGVGQ